MGPVHSPKVPGTPTLCAQQLQAAAMAQTFGVSLALTFGAYWEKAKPENAQK